MAGDWIKIEIATLNKPEVMRMSRILKVDRDLIIGKLCRLWSWFDCNSVDGVVDGVVDGDVDDIVGLAGFIDALKAVHWCDFDNNTERVWLTNFDAHNGESAKKRALKNKRQARWREGKTGVSKGSDRPQNSVDGNASTKASTREEKRREDSNTLTLSGESVKKRKSKTCAETEEAVCDYCESIGQPRSDGLAMWNHWEGNGHTNGGKAMKDWRAVIWSWKANGYLASQKSGNVSGNANTPANKGKLKPSLFMLKQQREEYRTELEGIMRPGGCGYNVEPSEPKLVERANWLRAELKRLKGEIENF